ANAQWNRAVTKDLVVPEGKAYEISDETLQKYGFENKQKFRNWRWYKGLGGGPISDLGAHQIDIFAYMFGGRPKSVMAGGGNDFYKKDWYDDVMCIYEFEKTYQGFPARAFYQVLTTSSVGGYFEQFFGTDGSIKMSENPALTKVFKERGRPELDAKWDKLVAEGKLIKKAAVETATADVRESRPPEEFGFEVDFKGKAIHQWHLENFLNTIRGKDKLNCDAEHAFEAEAAVYKVNEAVAAKKMLEFTDEDFKA
ncbi:MAG: gfo/Idh/MocA family oxidoreductase, partial [Opitutales bacterium]|nr:gfo/Idh/MocA family oxidoreductase [Opitutales bacterium]